ncbi:hypothetical protein [Lachnotalea glycerini]|uniref:Uncharacterized protein n=1 Tax=Lachnotalea glycerini TaxID=1763509 RepID=A0A371JCA9_9FIRM|nr:hypothetical protein [Lachnotalea glycerini]RDY30306.1 hypothetical protein CG710_015340 [Lachnotalea glycerini]
MDIETLLYFILSVIGFFLGIILVIATIIFRKRIEPSVMIAHIAFGIIITMFCAGLILVLLPVTFGFTLQD